jgi:hypothetical protein
VLPLDTTPPGTYRQRGASFLQRFFRVHFAELVALYEAEFAKRRGKFRLERISTAVERFLACGDYTCKVFHLCRSCSQKRTLLFGEHLNELLRLPHRQIVFTFPKVLRVFYRHDHGLAGDPSRLVYRMTQAVTSAAAGRRIQGAAVIACASAGDFLPIALESHSKRTERFEKTGAGNDEAACTFDPDGGRCKTLLF